jgi:hypothetical protein
MKKIAYLASRVTLPGSPIRRTDAFEHDFMMDALRGPFEARGFQVEDVAWDDAKADWTSYAAAIIGTTWDYWDRLDEFLAALERIEGQTRLFNGSALVRWNARKTYLRELETKGAKLIPTLWLDVADEAAAKAAFDTLGSDDLVFKRQVGAGAKDQHRLKRGEPIPEMRHPMMVQPFLKMIQDEGELSFIFIDGEFCHALVKRLPHPVHLRRPRGKDHAVHGRSGCCPRHHWHAGRGTFVWPRRHAARSGWRIAPDGTGSDRTVSLPHRGTGAG